jgi:hypothetical protein
MQYSVWRGSNSSDGACPVSVLFNHSMIMWSLAPDSDAGPFAAEWEVGGAR